MNTFEFYEAFMGATKEGLGAEPTVVIDKETGKTFSVKKVRREIHYDAGGSSTLWIEVEEN